MVRYSFLVRLSHPLLHAGFIRRSLITLSALTCTLPDWGNDKSKGAGFTLGPFAP